MFYLKTVVPSETYGEFDTTLVTMFTLDRMDRLIRLIKAWSGGPIIITMYTTVKELKTFKYMDEFKTLKNHPDLSMHVIFKAGVCLPC